MDTSSSVPTLPPIPSRSPLPESRDEQKSPIGRSDQVTPGSESEEAASMWDKISEFAISHHVSALDLFREVDTDALGSIDIAVFRAALSKLGVNI